jgi:hypothetical protein
MGQRARAAISNPFYALLVVAGIAFVITACAYGVMTLRAMSPQAQGADAGHHPLLEFLASHGSHLLIAEIALLAIATFAAIGTDDYWTRRANPQVPAGASQPGEKPRIGE